MDNESLLRLNLGCGLNAFPGWVNIDESWGPWLARHRWTKAMLRSAGALSPYQYSVAWPENIVRRDVTRGLPWPSGSAAAIYSANMINRLHPADVPTLLAECLRVLAPGGLLRVVLPDLESRVNSYLLDKQTKPDAGDLLMKWLSGRPLRWRRFPHVLIEAARYRPIGWAFDFDSFSRLADEAGFVSAKRCALGSGDCPNLQYEGRAFSGERVEQVTASHHFFYEATKPKGGSAFAKL